MIQHVLPMPQEHVNGLGPLPQGWQWRTIGGPHGVCIINPRRPRLVRGNGVLTSFLPMEGVDEILGNIQDLQAKPFDDVRRGYTYFEEDDVLFAKITPSMQNGKSAIARGLIDRIGFGSTEFHVLKPKAHVLPEWIHLYVRQTSFRSEARKHFKGAVGQQRVPQEFIEQYPIPLPFPDDSALSLRVQRSIVARIESLLSELREMRDLHATIDRDVGEVMESVLSEVIPAINSTMPEGWVVKLVRDISDDAQYGYTQSSTLEAIGPRFLRITDIQGDRVDWEQVPYCAIEDNKEAKYLLNDGDIVFARSGATTGKTYLVRHPPRAVFASYLIRLKPRTVLPSYLAWFFQSRDYWRQVIPQGAAQPNMNASLLKQIQVPVPENEDKQRQISAYLDAMREEVTEMQRIQADDRSLLEQVEQSILAQAFRGEL